LNSLSVIHIAGMSMTQKEVMYNILAEYCTVSTKEFNMFK